MSEGKDEPKMKSRRDYLKVAGAAVAGLAIGAGAGYAARAPPAPVEHAATVTETQTATAIRTVTAGVAAEKPIKDWVVEAAKPYRGASIKVLAESTPAQWFGRDTLGPEFEELTGIKVEYENLAWDEMLTKQLLDGESRTGLYDLYYVDTLSMNATFIRKGYIEDLYKFMKDNPKLVYPDYDLDDMIALGPFTVDGKLTALQHEFWIKTYTYRSDLFNDPKEKEKFKAKYGWELRVPQNWKEVAQIAEFFTRPEDDLYGWVAYGGPAGIGWDLHDYLLTYGITGYGVTLNRKASVKEGGRLDSQAAIDCLEMYTNLLDYGPPGVRSFGFDEIFSTWVAGRAAQSLIYADNCVGIVENPDMFGKLSLASTVPLETKYFTYGYPYIYGDMGGYSLASGSKNKEAAFIYLQWISSKENEIRCMRKYPTICPRKSMLASPLVEEIDTEYKWNVLSTFRDTVRAGITGTPFEPFEEELTLFEVLTRWCSRATAKEISAAEALHGAASEFDTKMKEIGWA